MEGGAFVMGDPPGRGTGILSKAAEEVTGGAAEGLSGKAGLKATAEASGGGPVLTGSRTYYDNGIPTEG